MSETTNTTDNNIAIPTNAQNLEVLGIESAKIINELVCEADAQKSRDLTDLFNQNQKKKTMVRLDKLGNLLDIVTDQAIERFTQKPDEISNQEIIQVLKTTQDAVERNQKLLNTEVTNQPFIQINQQTNELNVDSGSTLNKESRDKVKNAVASILAGLASNVSTDNKADVIVENGEIKND